MTPGESLLKLIQEQLNVKIKNDDMGTTLKELGADEIDIIEIATYLEEVLNMDISNEEADKIFGGEEGINTIFQIKNEIDALVIRRVGASG